jgi:hypothetical protein
MTKGKTPDEVRNMFNIKNDFSREKTRSAKRWTRSAYMTNGSEISVEQETAWVSLDEIHARSLSRRGSQFTYEETTGSV